MRFEILISKDLSNTTPNIYLDTFQEESLSFNFNIADITDISKKNSSYSKTISLPDTERNRRAFDDIFNLEAYDPTWADIRTFNPNKKVSCIVLGDTLEIFRGNLQLTNIVYDFDGYRNSYEVVIYSDNDTLFKIIGEQYLSDLNLSRYDHTYTVENIEGSWDNTYFDGYFYPLIDYGNSYYFVTNNNVTNAIRFDTFAPALFAKTIFDQIFAEAGFSYTSTFLNSPNFTELIIPFSNKIFGPNLQIQTTNANEVVVVSKNNTTSANTGGASPWSFYNTSLNLNVETYDPNGLYVTASFFPTVEYAYTNPSNETFRQKFKLYIKIRTTGKNSTDFWIDSFDDIKVWVKRSTNADGSNNVNFSNSGSYNQLTNSNFSQYFRDIKFNGGNGISVRNVLEPNGDFTFQNVGGNTFEAVIQCETDYEDYLGYNEKVRFFVTRAHQNPPNNVIFYTFNILPTSQVQVIVDKTKAVLGCNLVISELIPTKVKQKDFLMSIFKMFNLYIEPSKDLSNHFIIEPRDQYYNQYQVLKNWSDKIDLNSEISSEILSNLQKRTNLFSYKADKDFYNENYTTNTNDIFGQFRFEIDNDFISDENKIEPIFSPTPTDRLALNRFGIFDSSNIILPIIAKLNNGSYAKPDGMNMRILYGKKILLASGVNLRIFNPLTNSNKLYNYYPYAGPGDDPFNPQYTLNFGRVSSYYSGYNETSNNLFNTYYRNQISELNDEGSRLITANFNLNSTDINDFKFSDLIYTTINNMSDWYRVVKIIDFNPLSEDTTKVQLVKAYNYNIILGTPSPPPEPEYCIASTGLVMTSFQTFLFENNIRSFAGSNKPYLCFWNTYDKICYTYGTVSNNITWQDIINWVNTSGPPGLSIVVSGTPAVATITWDIEVLCGSDPVQSVCFMNADGITVAATFTMFFTPFVICTCDDLNRISPYQEAGTLNELPKDNVYVGVINTSTSNRTTSPNVIMVGSNNTIASSGMMLLGDNNSGFGENSLLVGESNQNTSPQSLIVGDSNIVNGSNTFALGSGNLVNSPQSFVLGVGNSIDSQSRSTYTFSLIGTTSVFGTVSVPSTQSMLVIGNDNLISNESGFIYGSNNLVGPSVSNQFIFGNNNNLGYTSSGVSGSNLKNVTIFGDNNSIGNNGTQSFANSFIIGNNITLTQSTTSSLFYIGTDTIEISTQNFITNVIGTSSFNKMTIADLTIKDELNYTPNFRFDQYNPGDYPNGSYLYFNSPIPDLELIYQNLDGYYLSIVNNVNNILTSEIKFGGSNIYLKGVDVTEQKTIRSDLNLYYETGINYGTTTSQISAGYDRIFEDNISGLISTERNQHFLNITTTSSVVQNYNLVSTNASFMTIEANIIGNDDPNFYFSKKIASFANGNQIGTTTTIYENTNFGTWSVDLNLDGLYANLAVSGGTTQSVIWKLYTKIYLH